MYLPVLCLTIMLFLSIHGDRLDTLEITMKALVSYIQTDLLLLRENISDNREQMSKLADLVNNSMTALTLQLNTAHTHVTSTQVTPKTDTEHMPDLKQDIKQLQSDVKRITRATYEEKRYGRQVYVQLKDAIIELQTNVQLSQNKTQKQLITSDQIVETTMNNLRNELKDAITSIETTLNTSSNDLNEMQVKMKDTIIENQINLTSETGDKLNRDNDILAMSLVEMKTKINEMQNEVGVDRNQFNYKLSQLKAYLITIQADINAKYTDVLQGLSNTTKLLKGTESQCLENRNHIEYAISSIETDLEEVQIEVLKNVRSTYTRGTTTRLANVHYFNNFSIGGRLEVLHVHEWGTVCDDDLNDMVATVACKVFGYANGKIHKFAYYGQGQGYIWLDTVACTGKESTIQECAHNEWGVHDCDHSEDAGVTCY